MDMVRMLLRRLSVTLFCREDLSVLMTLVN